MKIVTNNKVRTGNERTDDMTRKPSEMLIEGHQQGDRRRLYEYVTQIIITIS